jgi:hypothetical protein
VDICLQNSFNLLGSRFAAGFPELQIQPLDPLYFKHIPLNLSGIFDVKGDYKNVTLKGLAGIHFSEAKSDLRKYRIDLKFAFNTFDIRGIVDTVGRLIILPFRNHGDFTGIGSKFLPSY